MIRFDFPWIAIPCERRQLLSGGAADYSLNRPPWHVRQLPDGMDANLGQPRPAALTLALCSLARARSLGSVSLRSGRHHVESARPQGGAVGALADRGWRRAGDLAGALGASACARTLAAGRHRGDRPRPTRAPRFW
jgi:hypothetical protein